jgi:hypothetical protein
MWTATRTLLLSGPRPNAVAIALTLALVSTLLACGSSVSRADRDPIREGDSGGEGGAAGGSSGGGAASGPAVSIRFHLEELPVGEDGDPHTHVWLIVERPGAAAERVDLGDIRSGCSALDDFSQAPISFPEGALGGVDCFFAGARENFTVLHRRDELIIMRNQSDEESGPQAWSELPNRVHLPPGARVRAAPATEASLETPP